LKVAVVGAGAVGVASAHALAGAGHEVTVFERQSSVACEASFAHSGVMSGYLGIPASAGGAAGSDAEGAGLASPVFRARHALSPAAWAWWAAHRRAGRDPAVRVAALALSAHARQCHAAWANASRLRFEQQDGALIVLCSPAQQRSAEQAMASPASAPPSLRLLDADRVRRLEPALSATASLLGAWRWPGLAVGNCRHWSQGVRLAAEKRGARFVFNADVAALRPQARPVLQLGDGQRLEFDALVLCAGVGSGSLLQAAGQKLPLMPVYGYALTASIRHQEGHADNAPVATIIDPVFGVAITRLGQRLRVAGLAELGTPSPAHDRQAMQTLYAALDRWFPGAAARQTVQRWKGARATSPDGLPAIGESGLPGVWLNTGHGAGGWAWCAGSAELLAARLSGRAAAIEMTAFDPARWR
jgi:D-amino-acid dehydrogenase